MASDVLSIVITTSPSPTQPDTSLLDHVLTSFSIVDELASCHKIIVCDGYIQSETDRLKKGKVSAECISKYEEYKQRIRTYKEEGNPLYSNTTILELETRVGFGFAIQKAMPLVTTQYVMIVQHDRCFTKNFDLPCVLESMREHPEMRCILLPTTSTTNYYLRMDSKFHKRNLLRGREIFYKELCFLPLLQFYDSTHICTKTFYTEFIFPRRFVAKSGFIEDKLGQIQVGDIRKNGIEIHAKYGTFLYGNGFESLVQHLDGRDGLTMDRFTWAEDPRGGYKRVVHVEAMRPVSPEGSLTKSESTIEHDNDCEHEIDLFG